MDNPYQELIALLGKHRYWDTYQLLGDGNLRAWDWNRMHHQLPAPLKDYWGLFLVGKRMSLRKAASLVPEHVLDLLGRMQLLENRADAVQLKHSLISYHGIPFFTDRVVLPVVPSFGEEQKALISFIPPSISSPVGICHSGTGLEAVAAANRGSNHVQLYAPFANPDLLQANLQLNQVQHQVEISRPTNPWAAHPPKQVYANLTALPSPSPEVLPPSVFGGERGHRRLTELLEMAPCMEPEGCCLWIAYFFSKHDPNRIQEDLKRFFSESTVASHVQVISKYRLEPGTPLFNQLLAFAQKQSRRSIKTLVDLFLDHFEKMDVDAGYLLKGRTTPGDPDKRLTITDFSELYYGNWTF